MTTALRLLAPLALAAATLSCGGGGVPTAADVPVLLDEAAGKARVPRMKDSPARRVVRDSLRRILEADQRHAAAVAQRFQRPELRSYFLLPESFIGGTFPAGTAKLLREIDTLSAEYLDEIDSLPELLRLQLGSTGLPEAERKRLADEVSAAMALRRGARIEAVKALRRFATEAAILYELASAESGSLKAMREGLVISGDGLDRRFNDQVDVVNAAHDALDAALRALPQADQADFLRMGIATKIR